MDRWLEHLGEKKHFFQVRVVGGVVVPSGIEATFFFFLVFGY